MVANAARRAGEGASDPSEVIAGMNEVARSLGCPVERMRLLDYPREADRDSALPPLAVVLGTFGTWRKAKEAAASTTAMMLAGLPGA
jgi:hypothetical protein